MYLSYLFFPQLVQVVFPLEHISPFLHSQHFTLMFQVKHSPTNPFVLLSSGLVFPHSTYIASYYLLCYLVHHYQVAFVTISDFSSFIHLPLSVKVLSLQAPLNSVHRVLYDYIPILEKMSATYVSQFPLLSHLSMGSVHWCIFTCSEPAYLQNIVCITYGLISLNYTLLICICHIPIIAFTEQLYEIPHRNRWKNVVKSATHCHSLCPFPLAKAIV